MSALLDLAKRCEEATADEQAALLDEAFVLCVGPPRRVLEDNGAWIERRVRFDALLKWRAYESAALTLVPEGWQVSDMGENWRRGDWHSTLAERPNEAQRRAYDNGKTYVVQSEHGEAATPALALCAAALRVRAQQETSDENAG